MEDQSADSSDLNPDAATASVPQGKAARSRHRLPRQRAQHVDEAAEAPAVEAQEAVDPEASAPAAVEPDAVEPAAVEPAAVEPEAVEPGVVEGAAGAPPAVAEPKRRRLPWRRGEAAATPPESVESEAAVPEAGVPEAAPSEAAAERPGTEAAPAGEPSTAQDAAAEPAAEPDVVLVAHRTAGRVLKVAAVAAGVLFVAAAAFAGATIQPYLADRADVHIKFQIAETAASAITTLWTYTPDDMDKLPERSAGYLGGDFAADYKRYIDAIAAPNKQAQVSNNTQVLGAAIESLSPTEATAIVYTNSVATSPVTKGIPSLRYLSYRLTMKPQGDRWMITQMVAVTKLDLTPRL